MVNRPTLISGAAVVGAAIVAAVLWLTPGGRRDVPEDSTDQLAATAPALARNDSSTLNGLATDALTTPDNSAVSRPDVDSLNRQAADTTAARMRQEQESPEALAQYRQSLEQRYAGLGKALNLTPDEVNRILEIMVRSQKESMTGSSDLASLRRQAQETELMAALGSKYLQFEEYNLGPATRDTVDALQTLFEVSDVKPMTAAQAGSLATTLAAEQVRINRDLSSVTLPPKARDTAARIREEIEWDSRYTPEINRRLVLAASRHLDAQQLAAYRKMLEDGHNRVIRSMRADLAQREGSHPTGAPAANPN